MSGALKEIWEKVDQMIGPQRMETEAEHIARDMREGRFPERSDPIQVPVAGTEATAIARMGAGDGLVERATAALEGVTDGPWSVPGQPDKICTEGYTRNGMAKTIATVSTPAWMGDAEPWANARFIAFTRQWVPEAAAHIAALTAQNREMALDVLASSGQAAEAYAAQLAAEAERGALRAKVARLEGVLTDMPKAVLRTTICQGPKWPDDRPGVWLAALEACANSVQTAVDAALTDGGKDG